MGVKKSNGTPMKIFRLQAISKCHIVIFRAYLPGQFRGESPEMLVWQITFETVFVYMYIMGIFFRY